VRKRLTAAFLLGGHLLLAQAFNPVTALASSSHPATSPPAATASDHALHDDHHGGYDHKNGDGYHDDHYRCWYHCRERGYDWNGSHGSYYRDRHDDYYRGPEPYDRYGNGECWYHDRDGWHRCGYHWRYRASEAPPS
jgi:hypothetical protein